MHMYIWKVFGTCFGGFGQFMGVFSEHFTHTHLEYVWIYITMFTDSCWELLEVNRSYKRPNNLLTNNIFDIGRWLHAEPTASCSNPMNQ